MLDLSDYLAERTCAHVHQSVGHGSGFSDGVFSVISRDGRKNTLSVWNGYEISFFDMGGDVSVSVHNRDRKILDDLADRLDEKEFVVPQNYRKIVSAVRYLGRSTDGGLTLNVSTNKRYENRRTNNKDDFFN